MKIEKLLKENLKTSVVINESFKRELLDQLTQKNSSKLINTTTMLMGAFKKFFWVGIGSVATLAMLVVGFFVVDTYYPHIFQLNKSNLAKVSILQGTYKVNSEDVTVGFRYVEAGDRIALGENSFAHVTSSNVDIYMDSNSKVVINSLNGEVFPYVEYGNVVISSAAGHGGQVRAEVNNVDVYIHNGSAMANQTVEKKYSAMNSFFEKFVTKAYASESTSETKIVGVSGDVTVKKEEQEVKLDEGFEIELDGDKLGKAKETDKEKYDKVFCDEVVKHEKEHKKDPGTLEDLVAPVLSDVTPENGTTFKTNKTTVAFVSNEDGWYHSNDSWKEIKANTKVSFERKLTPNKNVIEFTVKDKAFNKTFVRLVINYDVTETIQWKAAPAANNEGVYLVWKAFGAVSGDKYLLYRNEDLYKTITVGSENKEVGLYYDKDTKNGVTYKYEVKLKRGDGVIADTTLVAVTAKTGSEDKSGSGDGDGTGEPTACNVTLYRGSYSSTPTLPATDGLTHWVRVEWSLSGDCNYSSGFKVVYNQTGSPVYPGSSYKYLSADARSTTIEGLSGGTWYARVCLYKPETEAKCTNYSNQVSVSF